MKSIIFLLIYQFAQTLSGQAQQWSRDIGSFVIYQSPANGDTYVPKQTTLIVRPIQSAGKVRTAQDFSFTVRGEQSGDHKGRILISDDNKTVIFKPDLPFAFSETVTVCFRILSDQSIPPLSYQFQISPRNYDDQNYRIKLLSEIGQTENLSFDKKQVEGNPSPLLSPFQTDSFPVWKASVDSISAQKVDGGNIFLNLGASTSYLEMLDSSGNSLFERVVYQGRDFRPWPNNMVSYYKYNPEFTILLDKDFTPLDSFTCGNGYQPNFHDFQLLPNGHVLLIGDYMQDTDMRIVTGDPNASKHSFVLGQVIQELDRNKNVVFQWRSGDYLSILDATDVRFTDPNTTVIDYAHLNSIDPDTDGNILLSFRAMDQVIKINRTTGNIVWRLGGKNNSFTFLGDTLRFSHQHDARRIANGHITLWDNGNFRKTKWGDGTYHDTAYSRAIEYALDETNFTAQSVWQYRGVPFCNDGGNVQRLPNGNTFICLGNVNVPNTIEVTPSGEKVFQLSLRHGGYNYRSYKFHFPFPQNAVTPKSKKHVLGISSIYPNPLSGVATVSLSLPNSGTVEVSIVDLLGHTIRSLNPQILSAGEYQFNLDASEIPNGTFFLRLLQNGNMASKIVVVQK